jgi:AraC-like DNA-binding protein
MSNALRIAYGDFGRVALLDMDRSLVRHAHPHCHVLLKVEGADTSFWVGNARAPLDDDTAVLVNGFETHAYVHDPRRPRTLILALYIEPEWLDRFQRGWSASGAPGFFARPTGAITPKIRHLGRSLAISMMGEPENTAAHESLLSALMIAVIERFAQWRAPETSIRAAFAPLIDWRVRKAMSAMQHELGDALRVEDVARAVGLSRPHFFRLFESSLKLSPRVYFNVLRLERAVEALVGGAVPVADISTNLGFSEPGHFSRFFRDHAGVSPSEFRRVARGAH